MSGSKSDPHPRDRPPTRETSPVRVPSRTSPSRTAPACEGDRKATDGGQQHGHATHGGPRVVGRVVVQDVALAVRAEPRELERTCAVETTTPGRRLRCGDLVGRMCLIKHRSASHHDTTPPWNSRCGTTLSLGWRTNDTSLVKQEKLKRRNVALIHPHSDMSSYPVLVCVLPFILGPSPTPMCSSGHHSRVLSHKMRRSHVR